ncbi:MAG: ABC transporter permease [Bacteroidota bacterium]
MFTEIFLFELKYRITRPATWIYFGIFFIISFLAINAMGGLFGNVVIISTGGKMNANSPSNINMLIQLLNLFGILIVSAIVGNPVYRDFEHDTHSLFYTKPITKFSYLAGRFFGSIVITLLVLISIPLGILIGSFMPYLDREIFGPFNLMAYIQPYLVFVIPNVIFAGAFFFTTATLTRNILVNYLGMVIFLVLYGIAGSLISDIDNETLAAMLDPMGTSALRGVTKYWTLAEKNTMIIPLTGILLLNRVVWISIAILILGLAYWKFKFSHFTLDKKQKSKPVIDIPIIQEGEKEKIIPHVKIILPKVSQSFSATFIRSQLWNFTKREFFGIVKNIYFIAIVFAGVVLLFVNGAQVGKIYGTPTYPVTYQVMDFLGGTFYLFMFIIIIFYSGELVWKERSLKINQIIDAMPISNGLQFFSKLFALIFVQVVLLFVVMFSGIIIQSFKGYYNFEIGLYFKELFGVNLIDWILMCVLAMFVQVLTNHKFLGYFIMIVYCIFTIFQEKLGLEHKLYQYSSDIGIPYSDMNGYGHFVFPFIVFKIYWASFAVMLAIFSNLLWVRGTETNFKLRWKLAKQKFDRTTKLIMLFSLIVFLGCGSFIFYNTNILNKYQTSNASQNNKAEFEKKYSKYKKMNQPKNY